METYMWKLEKLSRYSLTFILMCAQDWRGRNNQGAYFEVVPPRVTETFKFPLGEDSQRKESLDVYSLAVYPGSYLIHKQHVDEFSGLEEPFL